MAASKQAKRMGRPLDPQARKIRVLVQFNEPEKQGLERLVKLRQADLEDESVDVNAQDVIRWLIARELRSRGDAL